MRREEFLARVRSAMPQSPAPTASALRHPLPAFARLDETARLSRFTQSLAAQGAEITEVDALSALPTAVEAILANAPPRPRLVIANDARLTGLAWPVGKPPSLWQPGDMLGDGTAALSHAWGAVAETGTLVMVSSGEGPASLAFLPELHIVAVEKARIVAAFEDALWGLGAEWTASRFPRAVNLVSSPSRTSDIGGRSVRGAHGPRRLSVVIYG